MRRFSQVLTHVSYFRADTRSSLFGFFRKRVRSAAAGEHRLFDFLRKSHRGRAPSTVFGFFGKRVRSAAAGEHRLFDFLRKSRRRLMGPRPARTFRRPCFAEVASVVGLQRAQFFEGASDREHSFDPKAHRPSLVAPPELLAKQRSRLELC